MFCPRCGATQNEELKFCKSCGVNLNAVRQLVEPGAKKFDWSETWVAGYPSFRKRPRATETGVGARSGSDSGGKTLQRDQGRCDNSKCGVRTHAVPLRNDGRNNTWRPDSARHCRDFELRLDRGK